ncbi:hypothetical protein [Cellulomonas soli]
MVDPETGLAVGDAGSGGSATATGAVATQLEPRAVGSNLALAGLAGAELLAIVLVPGLLAVRRRRAAGL